MTIHSRSATPVGALPPVPVSALLLLLASIPTASSHDLESESCPLDCHHDAHCVRGGSSLDDMGKVGSYPLDVPAPWMKASAPGGWRCACPDGWGGLSCEHRYEVCDPRTGFACFHGATCRPNYRSAREGEGFYCDCSTASWPGGVDSEFAGRHCEHRATDECTVAGGGQWFCVNDGDCQSNESDVSKRCKCEDGWFGPHCEYHKGTESDPSDAQVRNCTLPCRNGGWCAFGLKDYGDHVGNNEAKQLPWAEERHKDGMHCICPTGYTGTECEIPADRCGDSLWCYNGSKCKKLNMEDGTERRYCDCPGGFAGLGCQHEATEICLPSEQESLGFCSNGGVCSEDVNGVVGCICPDDYSGPHCEFHESETEAYEEAKECTLPCENGGTCAQGLKDYSDHTAQNAAIVAWAQERHEDGMHCVCPEGYTGVRCQIPAQKCGDKLWCYNGSECERLDMEDGTSKNYCDCAPASTKKGHFGGLGCQYMSSEICYPGDGEDDPFVFFCTNGGKCSEDAEGNLGCICPDDYSGPNCEYHKSEATAYDEAKECTLPCRNGGSCTKGLQDYGDQVDNNNEAKHLPWAEERHKDGMHCICPTGYTGTECQIPADQCGNKLWCYNGSKCKKLDMEDGTERAYCDCPGGFAGLGCQHEATDICLPGDDPGHGVQKSLGFCTNGGVCSEDENGDVGCICPDDYSGPHCEYHASETEAYDEASQCTLECDFGGKCAMGPKDYRDHKDNNKAKQLPWVRERSQTDMHCVCPEGYTGLRCQIPAKKCGKELWCYHNSTCEKAIMEDGTVRKYCDCSGATTETTSFAGIGCQHEQTTVCHMNDDPGAGNRDFCTNYGECSEGENGHLGCVCPDGYSGEHCQYHESESSEYTDPSQCKLECKNGGKCLKGVKDLDATANLEDLPFEMKKKHQNFEFCSCPPGYGGLDCSIRVDACGGGKHICMHGAECIHVGTEQQGVWEWKCDCVGAYDQDHHAVAGKYCQHSVTEYCEVSGNFDTSWNSFCTNGGTCRTKIQPGEDHPGCLCKKGWTGDFCEFQKEADKKREKPKPVAVPMAQSSTHGEPVAILFTGMVGVVGIIIFGAVYATVYIRRRAGVAERADWADSCEVEEESPKQPPQCCFKNGVFPVSRLEADEVSHQIQGNGAFETVMGNQGII